MKRAFLILVHAESGAKIDVDPKYGVVAFLQDRATKRIFAAASR